MRPSCTMRMMFVFVRSRNASWLAATSAASSWPASSSLPSAATLARTSADGDFTLGHLARRCGSWATPRPSAAGCGRGRPAPFGLGLPRVGAISHSSGPRRPYSSTNPSHAARNAVASPDAGAEAVEQAGDAGVERRGQLGRRAHLAGQVPQGVARLGRVDVADARHQLHRHRRVADGLADGEQDAGRHARARRRDRVALEQLAQHGLGGAGPGHQFAVGQRGRGRAARRRKRFVATFSSSNSGDVGRGHEPAEVGHDLVDQVGALVARVWPRTAARRGGRRRRRGRAARR